MMDWPPVDDPPIVAFQRGCAIVAQKLDLTSRVAPEPVAAHVCFPPLARLVAD